MSTPQLTTDPQGAVPSLPRRLVLLGGDTAATGVSARRHVVRVMRDGGVDDDTAADVELLVSEVIGNFLRHEGPHEIDVDVAVSREHAVTVVVTGGTSGQPVPLVFGVPQPTDAGDSGRGLRLLDTLTTSWGTRRRRAATSLWFTVGGAVAASGNDPGPPAASPPVSAALLQQLELSLAVPSATQDAVFTVAMAVFRHDDTPAPADVSLGPAVQLHRASTRLCDAVDEFDCALGVGLALPELVRRDTEVAAASTQCLEAAIACHSRHGG